MEVTVKEIVSFYESIGIKYRITGEEDVSVHSFCPLNALKSGSVTWARHLHKIPIEKMNEVHRKESLILVAEYGEELAGAEFPVIYAENAQRAFFLMTERFFGFLNPENRERKIERTAVVDTKQIGKNVYIGHHTYIASDVSIGDNVTIMHNVTIEGGTISIGDHTIIESGTTIGAQGFSYFKGLDEREICAPHYGGVRIGNHVKIGANNTIIRGCLADTVIEDDVKTADLVCISHNDLIKQGAQITCGVMIAGSTTVGEHSWIAPGAVLNNGVNIGENSYVGIGSVVLKKVREGHKVFGVPAINID
ncbi:hypothetical protein GN277_09365 [Lachnospiraceae bacterium WCA-9-b2]|jgi:UDP-3-O-[3-hydroxymyristoyl] glucosamine N-acyltransferase|uniref:UDP-3-O-(3-hydroxymyristoyl)glucosamine N-acyltransferase n=1 Tax=Sporofaciens musculi TaxID=2681861 RepID=A0A7X3MFP7_9FIRM|nr:hypothetical protein [Sporofaciens musculi]MXP75585.1 hypothetical protein [Sporofaciens musculi]